MSDLPNLGDDDAEPQGSQGSFLANGGLEAVLMDAVRDPYESDANGAMHNALDAEARLLRQLTAHLDERLQRGLTAVTTHLEGCIKHSVHESHDAIVARIEDVAAVQVARAAGSPDFAGFHQHVAGVSDVAHAAGTGSSALGKGQVESLQQNTKELETLVMRIATTTARDVAAAREKTAAELRAVSSTMNEALDDLEGRLDSVRRQQEEYFQVLSRQQEEDRAQHLSAQSGEHLNSLQSDDALSKLKAEVLSGVRAEFASRDKDLSWLSELRAHVNIDSQTVERPPSPVKQDALIMSTAVTTSTSFAETSYTETIEGLSIGAPRTMPSGVTMPSTVTIENLAEPADGASADAGAGSSPRSLAAKLAALAADRDDPKGSAVANLYKWFASASTSPKAGDSAVTRGRPKSKAKPTAAPTRELIRAAAQELVNIKNSEDKDESNSDPFELKTPMSPAALVEELHTSGSFEGTVNSGRKVSFGH